ncbi:MAG TPA: hypothetical protein VEW90_01790 [Gaiellaceae bacterium]|nr:hypothetical protein [Gaiellaceae bacterium]
MTRRDKIMLAVSVVAVPIALVLVVLAIDVLRTPGWISEDDSRFASAPLRGSGLWNEPGLLATRARLTAVGAEDDLAYRRVVALFKRLRPGEEEQGLNAEKESRWAKLQFDLTNESRDHPEPKRRSGLQNLLGVTLLARYLYASPDQRSMLLSNAVGAFRTAVELDPANDDAKLNLELSMRAYSPILFPSNAPDAGGARGQESGQGRSGSGY